jgi:hypothetical protein
LIHYLNFEVVRELGSLASVLDLKFLADPTFVLGSAIAVSRPFLLTALLGGSLYCARRGFDQAPVRVALGGLALAGVLFAAHSLWPVAQGLSSWRQLDFVHDNSLYLLNSSARQESVFVDPPTAMLQLIPGLAGDLTGEPIFPLPGKAKNVLIVIVEGISGALLPSLARDHGFDTWFEMKHLDAFATQNLSYSTFVTHNRKTNRGVYSILCGEPPNLVPGPPKMTQHALGGWRICLPDVLADAGYETVYAQAAPLSFMLKGQFAKRAGFAQVYGYEHFDMASAAAATRWGVDDRTLYEQSLEIIESLREGDRPWFFSLLTVGTHHPFVIPPAFEQEGRSARHSAYLYADHALSFLIGELKQRGIFDDTLVLITSDESQGLKPGAEPLAFSVDGVTESLWQNWGFLIASQPEGAVERIAAPNSQMDIATSVVDYLGLADRADHFFGRSIFRSYEAGRYLPFANTNERRAALITDRGVVFYCRLSLAIGCLKWTVPDGRYFGQERNLQKSDSKSEDKLVLEFARRSQADLEKLPQRREIDLLTETEFKIEKQRMLHGGSYINLKTGQWLEVEIEVTAHGEAGSVMLIHYFRQPHDWAENRQLAKIGALLEEKVHLKDGEVFHLKYTVTPRDERPLDGVKVVTHAKNSEKTPFRLVFQMAQIRIHDGAERRQPGVKVEVKEIKNRAQGRH